MKTKKEIKDWLTSLEAERLDQSWKKPKKEQGATEYTKIVYRDKVVDTRFRDEIFYNAGRYAEGARDDQAVNAQKIATNLIKERLKK